MNLPIVFGINGLSLTEAEKKLFSRYQPSGYILFSRNIDNITQVKNLTTELQALSNDGHKRDIYIDQEGGRVRRLKPPLFRECPSASSFYEMYLSHGLSTALKATYDNYYAITCDLLALGINVNCVPVADLYYPAAHKIIGDRSFGYDAQLVTEFCLQVMQALQDAGGKYIIKHIPGHGRAKVDSHLALPIIFDELTDLAQSDFLVFKNLANRGANLAMTAHVIYNCLDEHLPVTLSNLAIQYIRNDIGFTGTLISDDLNMQALKGDIATNALTALKAGCDLLLHCSGDIAEMTIIAESINIYKQQTNSKETNMSTSISPVANQLTSPFILPALPYAIDAFAPRLSAESFEYHHGKHHNSYVNNLNNLVATTELADHSLEEIMLNTHSNSEKLALYNNAAQIWNHSFFWHCLTPVNGGGQPSGQLLAAIEQDFGNFAEFREQFKQACLSKFGSGWAWLCLGKDKKLHMIKTPNAENPIYRNYVPLLTCDVWEHAYYIDFRNNRAGFVDLFLDHLLNWQFVEENYQHALAL